MPLISLAQRLGRSNKKKKKKKKKIRFWSYISYELIVNISEGNMTICSPEAGKRAYPRVTLTVEGEQIILLPSHKGNSCAYRSDAL